MKVTAIILAGGKSLRMKSDKGLVCYKGKPLIEYALNLVKPFCQSIIISTQNPAYKIYNYPLVSDIFKNIGPMGGIHAGLMASQADMNLIISCDMPHLNSQALELLINQTSDAMYNLPSHKTGLEPLFAIVHKKLLPELEKNIQLKNYKLMHLIDQVSSQKVDFNELLLQHPSLFDNKNTPKSLQ
jgi:molybdopterin-guanine dinucleotide biosynthesis protein A